MVSDREYKKTSRGIDIITSFLAEKNHQIDHLVFFRRKKYPEKQIAANIRQLYFYDSIKLYRGRLQFLFPGFILLAYFRHIIRKQTSINFCEYDYVILESGNPVYLSSEINNKIIYRQSDPTHICFNSNRNFYKKLEVEVIKKACFATSALDETFYPHKYKEKIFFWHSGFIPCSKTVNKGSKKYFVIMGGDLDWNLLKKMAGKFTEYLFYVIGISGRNVFQKNIVSLGYLGYNDYQELLSSALLTIIPFSNHYVHQLRQVSFTAKILVSMQLGMPILLRAYGSIQNSDPEKKLYVYNTRKEAVLLLNEIIRKIECGELNYAVSEKTQDFLTPQTSENRRKELEAIFNRFL